MSLALLESLPKPRLKALLDHFATVEDPRVSWRVAHPLPEVLLLVVCGTICACDDYEAIADWGEANLAFLRRHRPYDHGVPCGRWLTLLMNRINPTLFSAAFTDWVRATWPDRLDLVALDGKTSRRSHDRAEGRPPLHLVSAFATTRRLVLGQEAVPDKAGETAAIPVLIERLFTPRLRVKSYDELNGLLLERCVAYAKAHRHPEQPDRTVWEMFEAERPHLVRHAGRFDGFHALPASVSKTCLVRFDNNRYSVNASAVGRPVEIQAYAERIVIKQDGRILADHARLSVAA